jgi:copper transporter 1
MPSMTMSTTPSSTMSAMSMASSTAMSSSDMTMQSMAMIFFTSTSTPLYSMSWMPNSIGQYAGTCIFLIAFAAIFRALLAIRINFFEVLAIVKHQSYEEAKYPYLADAKSIGRPWRINEAVLIAFMDVVLAASGYLL